ncbi:hypothetical protein EDB84DRAFT_1634709 [Lactarius hengduanensis]|nr:hypothetical protein EDB84DRAFT_1634709 [Lactarius hengduanensis]
MPAAPRPPEPSLLPRPRRHVYACGKRAHEDVDPGPSLSTLARRLGAHGRSSPPLRVGPASSLLSAQPRSRGQGACEGSPPLLVGSIPAPSLLSAPPRMRGRGHARSATPPPFPIRAEGGCARMPPLSPLPPTPPLPAPYARDGGTRRHAAPGPLLLLWAAPPRTRGHATPGPTLPHSRGRGHEGMPPFSPSLPTPPLPALYAQDGGTRGHTAPGPTLPHSRGRGCTRARGPLSPSLPAPPPWPRRPGQGHDAPGRPIRAEGGAPSACRPVRAEQGHAAPAPRFPLVRAIPFARKGGMRGQAAPSRDAPFAREWVHEAKPCRVASKTGVVSVRPHPVCAA